MGGVEFFIKKRVLTLLLVLSVLVLSGCTIGLQGYTDFDLTAYDASCQSNGYLTDGNQFLCLKDQGGDSIEQNQFCCYRPDGSACSAQEMSKLVNNTADEWTETIISDVTTASLIANTLKSEFQNNVEGNCIDSYTLTLEATDSDDDTSQLIINDISLVCQDSNAYSQDAIIIEQGLGENHIDLNPQTNLFVCYDNQWWDEEKISDNDAATDGDGVGLFWDCDPNNPNSYGDMTMYLGFDTEAQEVCGDGEDNMCLDPYTFSASGLPEIDMDLPGSYNPDDDVCDNNPYACENHCLFADNSCDYLLYDGPIEDSSDSDLEIEDGIGFCCGDNFDEDLGTALYHTETDMEYICLNDNFVTPEPCSGEDENGWCWVDAQTDPFAIYTVKQLGEPAYDVMGNHEEWFVCSEETAGPQTGSHPIHGAVENRFYCYNEGDHYSLAECSDPADAAESTDIQYNEDTIKHRTAAQGTFALPLAESGSSVYYVDFRDGEQPVNYLDSYEEIYTIEGTQRQTIDFTGYDYLEFFFKFTGTELYLPESLNMTIIGLPENVDEEDQSDTVYFSQNVLGYAVNQPLLEPDHNIHIRVPITGWPDVESIILRTSSERNNFEVLSMYLTKESDIASDEVPICSGIDSSNMNNWLTDLDWSSTNSLADGNLICDFRYGSNAWLGDYFSFEVDVEHPQAACCGDDQGEFYAGTSANEYGCFNGVPIENEKTAMQVEFEVGYNVQEYELSYPEVEALFEVQEYEDASSEIYNSVTISENISYVQPFRGGTIIEILSSYTIDTQNSAKWEIVNQNLGETSTYFFTPSNQEVYRDEIIFSINSDFPRQLEVWWVAETNLINSSLAEETTIEPETFSYTCVEEECVYALPGSPPYQITNTRPDLYDLYFITIDENNFETEILITSEDQQFNSIGVIKASSISQQILFDFDQTTETGGFYGCEAADFVLQAMQDGNAAVINNYDYCAVQGEYYCAHQDSRRLVNSWSLDQITEIAYEPVTEWDENTELNLQSVTIAANERIHSTAAVPQRNIVPNADFSQTVVNDADNIAHWKLLDGADNTVANEIIERTENGISIDSGYSFLSDNIAIASYQSYSYTDNNECSVTLTKIDRDGNAAPILVPENFESGNNSFLKIEVQGGCDYAEPMLQRIDAQGAGVFEFNADFPTRQGVACCPENMCWNGYVCANNMAEYTYMTEEPQENETYRCINGEWNYLEPQYDWNGEESGFCETQDQCFVTSSLSEGAQYGATAEDFYNGVYPYCIDNGEYLLDHYCENGNWTSRTKFLATKLLEFAESDDFVLYCAPFQDAFPDYATDSYNKVNYLAGKESATLNSSSSFSAQLTGDPQTVSTTEICFDALENSETGRRLVKQEENTCINAVCLLQYKSGNTFEAAFATSLNHDITSQEFSFLIPLGVPQADLDTHCTLDNSSEYLECDDSLWYNNQINSVLYAKEGISFNPNFIDNILGWFFGLFGTDVIEESEDFIEEAQNFNKLYLLSKEGFTVRAVQEVQAEEKTLVAEYEDFDLPICDYINGVNAEYTMVEQFPADPEVLVECELTEEGVYRIMTATHLDYWWPQLTSKLRVAR